MLNLLHVLLRFSLRTMARSGAIETASVKGGRSLSLKNSLGGAAKLPHWLGLVTVILFFLTLGENLNEKDSHRPRGL